MPARANSEYTPGAPSNASTSRPESSAEQQAGRMTAVVKRVLGGVFLE
ncbi:MAG TPA: hypothetical protein VHW09_18305 [Bryobacteraceae bacterium]|jgi:hypothetical protein|nr:hypothetical protein [Bryobacteraceae bacterium]